MAWNPFSTTSTSSSPTPRRRPSSSFSSSASSSRQHHSSTSRYKRSPRDSYMQRLYRKLRHFLRQLWSYAQRHPLKLFFMLVVPLLSGGVLTRLGRRLGLGLDLAGRSRGARAGYTAAPGGGGGGYYGSQGYGMDGWNGEAKSSGAGAGAGGMMMNALSNVDLQSVAGGIGGLASLASMASKFM